MKEPINSERLIKRVMVGVIFQQLLMEFMNVVYEVDPNAGVCGCLRVSACVNL